MYWSTEPTRSEHDSRLHKVLERLHQKGVALNKEKFCFSVGRVLFLGMIFDAIGARPDPEKVWAIKELPRPQNAVEVRSLLGMVNCLARFLPDVASTTAPFRSLLCIDNYWSWGPQQEQALVKIKDTLSSERCLARHNPGYPRIVSADASSYGLSAVLLQDQPSRERRPVAYASRSLMKTDRRYSQIEKEALALTWAAECFDEFLRGPTFLFETDHKLLLPLLGRDPLDSLPPRIQRFRMRLDEVLLHPHARSG